MNDDYTDESSGWRKGYFGTDATPGPYLGYTRGDLWNGWATPVFDKKEALRIAADTEMLSSPSGRFVARYDAAQDSFIFQDPEADEADEPFEATVIVVDGRERTVYPIGTYSWTWEEAEAHT